MLGVEGRLPVELQTLWSETTGFVFGKVTQVSLGLGLLSSYRCLNNHPGVVVKLNELTANISGQDKD